MLQFFKKSSRKNKNEISDNNEVLTNATNPTTSSSSSFDKIDDNIGGETAANTRIHNDSIVADDTLFEAEQYCQTNFTSTSADESTISYDSKLSKDITKIVTNHQLLSYFIQFLENRNALSLIKFWLEAENFKLAASTEFKNAQSSSIDTKSTKLTKSNLLDKTNSLTSTTTNSTTSNSNTTVTDVLVETCNVGRSLTDDEKTELFEQKNCIKLIKESFPLNEPAQTNSEVEFGDVERQCFKTSLSSDAIYIFKKYLTTKSTYYIDIPATILSKISLALVHNGAGDKDDHPDENNQIIPEIGNIFCDAQQFVLDLLKKQHLQLFIESSYYCKYCMDILTGNTLCIQDILHCESVLFFFMEFLEQENCRQYLEFWIAVNNFRETVNFVADDTDTINKIKQNKLKIYNYSPSTTTTTTTTPTTAAAVVPNALTKKQRLQQIQSDAVVLYDKYISLQATTALGLSNTVRLSVEENICTTDPIIIFHCFDLPIQIIERYLDQKYFKSFLSSNLFKKYLTELSYKIDFSNYVDTDSAGGGTNISNSQYSVDGTIGSTNKNELIKYSNTKEISLAKNAQSSTSVTNAGGTVAQKCHRKTNSDCTNQNTIQFRTNKPTISCQNTLLAMDTSNNKNKKSTTTVATPLSSDMLIDSQQMYNPDLLWRPRRSASMPYGCGLSFGHIDALGRYKRDFDMDSTNFTNSTTGGLSMTNGISSSSRSGGGVSNSSGADSSNKISSTGSKIRQVVRKLVNMPEEREQEEIAWQVAEMIVKDITSVTLSKNENIGDNYVDQDDDNDSIATN